MALLITWLALCAWTDLRGRRIPNALILAGLAVASTWLIATGQSLVGASVGQAFLALLVALLLTLPGYALGRMGAGDVKLMAVLGLASSPAHVLFSALLAALGMVIVALLGPCLRRSSPTVKSDPLYMPYAPFVLTGLLLFQLVMAQSN
ncbi:prepilin peptidase [Pseudomonas sp. ABC1]|uniref:prepilin peptidase n=1 Tax=Pseudomonas sp. ABC1 TaxID=2748080 RepID=UPI0015C34797|nr:prepilin peptidase [Pseudomonas sp. ABC1]QLF93138.1 prepilin peptidase [Pseudomonas sp. ABC1]